MDDRVPPLSHAPDGLYESDIDALLAEYFTTDVTPCVVIDQVAANRRARRLTRQNIGLALRVRSIRPNQTTTDGTAA